MKNIIAVAGASGDIGVRMCSALAKQGAQVRALVRAGVKEDKRAALRALDNVKVIELDTASVAAVTLALDGVTTLVSTLAGLRDVIVDAQAVFLDAAVAAGVQRFIPSDFSVDFLTLTPGENRNFDLRREFHERLAKAKIKSSLIFNGAFAETLNFGIPMLDFRNHRVGYCDDADWSVDMTLKNEVAAFTAAVALDADAPHVTHCSSFRFTPREMAAAASEISGTPYALVQLSTRAELAERNRRMRAENPAGENELYPAWQQGQYMQSIYSAPRPTLDNARYPSLTWTSLREFITPIVKRAQ